MYGDNYEEEEEVVQNNGSFLVNFYNNNKKLIWILGIIIIVLLLASLLTKNKGETKNENIEHVITLELAEKELQLSVGNSYILDAKVKDNDKVLNSAVIAWESDNEKIASVSTTGIVKANELGTATITGTYVDLTTNKLYEEHCVINVFKGNANEVITDISFGDGDLMLMKGSEFQLNPVITPRLGYIENETYIIDDENVVTIDENGVVKAKNIGSTTITFVANQNSKTAREFSKEINVYVLDKNFVIGIIRNPSSISFESQVIKVKEGEKKQLNISVEPEKVDSSAFEWTSSNEEFVTVKNGVITAIKEGTSTITVKGLNGVSSSVIIEVEKNIVDVKLISLPSTSIEMNVDTQEVITPNVFPEDASNKAMDFASSDNSVVTVIPNAGFTAATIYAHRAGSADITITSKDGKANSVLKVIVKGNNQGGTVVNPTTPIDSGNNSGNNDNNGSSNGSSGGRWYSEREYEVSSSDAQGNGTMWSTYSGVIGNGGSVGPVKVTISISSKATKTKTLRVCYYNYGSTPCTESSASSSKVAINWSKNFTSLGTYVIRVYEYNSDGSLRRGPDEWFIYINKSNSNNSTSMKTINSSGCYVSAGSQGLSTNFSWKVSGSSVDNSAIVTTVDTQYKCDQLRNGYYCFQNKSTRKYEWNRNYATSSSWQYYPNVTKQSDCLKKNS